MLTRGWCRRGAVLLACTLLAACSKTAVPPPPSYRVSLDVTPWIGALGSDDLFESEPANRGLVALGSSALPALDAALQREPAPVRVGIVEVLRDLALPECIPPLVRAGRDPDEEVRVDALAALGFLEDERGRDLVEDTLNDPHPKVAAAAAAACAILCRSPIAFRRLAEMAVHPRTDRRVMASLNSLGDILRGRNGDADRIAAARGAVRTVALPLLHPDMVADRRERAALLIAYSGGRDAVPWLNEMVDRGGSPLLQIQAFSALGSLGDENSVAVLRRVAQEPGNAMRSFACRTLKELAARDVDGAADASSACAGSGRKLPPVPRQP